MPGPTGSVGQGEGAAWPDRFLGLRARWEHPALWGRQDRQEQWVPWVRLAHLVRLDRRDQQGLRDRGDRMGQQALPDRRG